MLMPTFMGYSMIKKVLLFLFSICFSIGGFAQLYPDTSANWCLDRTAWPPLGGIFSMVMYADADTLIDGQVYRRIYDNSHITGTQIGFEAPVYYVRNAPNGKSYAYILEDGMEYLTADLNAQVGDTVDNVLVWNEQEACPNILFEYGLTTIKVDSIVDVLLLGNLSQRYYLSSICYPDVWHNPITFFWQPGVGTSHGPILSITNGLDRVEMMCAEVADTMVYSIFGDPCDCIPYNNVSESDGDIGVTILAGPVLGTYSITYDRPLDIEVFNSAGALVHHANGLRFDISAQPPGIYAVRLRGQELVWSQKVLR